MKEEHDDKQTNEPHTNPEETEIDEVLFDEEGGEEAVEDKVKRLREKLKRAEKGREENLTGWQRAKADFVNLKKREGEIKQEAHEEAVDDVVKQIFPLLDSFEGAFSSSSWEQGDEDFKKGFTSIYDQFLSVLKDVGVEEIGVEGEQFDPQIHTSVSTQETNDKNKDDTIAEVYQKGYRYHDRLMRSPKVVVYDYKDSE